jgi:hypothetical protein
MVHDPKEAAIRARAGVSAQKVAGPPRLRWAGDGKQRVRAEKAG